MNCSFPTRFSGPKNSPDFRETGPWLGRKWSRTWAKMMKNNARITLKKTKQTNNNNNNETTKNKPKQKKNKKQRVVSHSLYLSLLSLAIRVLYLGDHDHSHVISINRGA